MSSKHTRIYLLRHGRTDWNHLRRIQGKIDRPLDEEGRKEAMEVARQFADKPLGAIYSSTLIRAKETAEIISQYHNVKVETIYDLHEGSYGVLDGIFVEEFERKFAESVQKRKEMMPSERFHVRIAEGAETSSEVVERVLPHLKALSIRHRGESILVVTHGWVMRALITYFKQPEQVEVIIRNCGHIILEGLEEKLQLTAYEEAVKKNL